VAYRSNKASDKAEFEHVANIEKLVVLEKFLSNNNSLPNELTLEKIIKSKIDDLKTLLDEKNKGVVR
jgi:hypothetical protein